MANSKKSTAMEIAYNLILEKITRERLAPGTPLREEHLAEEFGISTTPIREAFRSLEYEGWVQRIPYRGTCLRSFTNEEVMDLYRLREALEGIAVKLAIERATAEDWQQLEDTINAEIQFIATLENDSPQYQSFYDMDRLFHQAIVTAAHSPILQERNTTLRTQLTLLVLSSQLKNSIEEIKQIHEEHKMIFDAMKRNWADAAEKLLRAHIAMASSKFQKKNTNA